MGSYKVLLIYTSIVELVFAILDIIMVPSSFLFDSILVLYTNKNNRYFSFDVSTILISFYCGMFGVSLGLFPVLFIYRYFVLSKNKLLESFSSRHIFLWLCIPLIFGFMFGGVTHILNAPHDYKLNQIEPYLNSIGFAKENITYLCLFFKTTTVQDRMFQTESVQAVVLMNIILIFSGIPTIYFGAHCYKLMHEKLNTSNISDEYRNIQLQFFYALVVQTIIPFVLLHIPASIVLLSTVFNINLGLISGIASVAFSVFPAVDPLPTIFIIKSYRNATKPEYRSISTILRQQTAVTSFLFVSGSIAKYLCMRIIASSLADVGRVVCQVYITRRHISSFAPVRSCWVIKFVEFPPITPT
ncbi:unnamed protein product [Caenorhabditis angaria]|uniref:Seven TM Receptor n=1 Tax=Caenorhabditis angaria TaxID=860376 RepID=A0A9P1J0G6_9PELO|nr:unnamed protein product [Caenorhabditis angaria]